MNPDFWSVVVGALLFEENRKVLLTEVSVEVPVEGIHIDTERLFDRLFDVAGQEDLAVLVDEVVNAFRAVILLDEVEDGMAEAVAQIGQRIERLDGRNEVVDDRVPDDHPVEAFLVLPEIRRHPLDEPYGNPGAQRPPEVPLEEERVLEDVRELVRNELVEFVRRLVDRQDDPVLHVFRERSDRLGKLFEDDVRLLELPMGLVDHHRDAEAQLVVEFLAQSDVGALRVRDDLVEKRLGLGVEVDVEVR